MQTRALGPDAPKVTAIGFGGMPLSLVGRPDEADAIRVIHSVLDAGITLIDTADVYCLDASDIGHNEQLIAKALASWKGDRSGLVLASKGGLVRPDPQRWEPNCRPEHLRSACERSLRALGVERIDLYQLHTVDPAVPYEDSVGALADLRSEGKIRWVGISNVSIPYVDIARQIVPVQTVQNILSPFFRQALEHRFFRPNLVTHCARHGIAFLAYSPVGGAYLNKKLREHPVVKPIAERHGRSTHAIVLAWVLAQGANVIPVVGARTV